MLSCILIVVMIPRVYYFSVMVYFASSLSSLCFDFDSIDSDYTEETLICRFLPLNCLPLLVTVKDIKP